MGINSKKAAKYSQNPSALAINEVLNPTFEITKQILAVHQPVLIDGIPQILRVDDTSEPGAYYVYFSLMEQPYYLVVVIRPQKEGLSMSWAYIEAGVRVYLVFVSSTITPEEITQRMGLLPTTVHHKGEQKRLTSKKYDQNTWIYEPEKDIPGEIEQKIKNLLSKINHIGDYIAQLPDDCYACINVCYEGYTEWMGGWHLDKDVIKKIAALGLQVDVDLYAWGPELPDS